MAELDSELKHQGAGTTNPDLVSEGRGSN